MKNSLVSLCQSSWRFEATSRTNQVFSIVLCTACFPEELYVSKSSKNISLQTFPLGLGKNKDYLNNQDGSFTLFLFSVAHVTLLNSSNCIVLVRDASIRYSGSVSAPIRSFSADRVSERRDRSKSDIVCILFCVIVKPHESTKAL